MSPGVEQYVSGSIRFNFIVFRTNVQSGTHHTNNGSKNCMTITKPNVTNMRPRFNNNMRQHMPLVFGQKGFGADIVSTVTPGFRVIFDLTVDTSDGARPLLRYE